MFKRPKIGLALGGGGARGLAHIGVLKIFEEENIPIDIITGTSVGSVIGGMYAQNPSIKYVENKMRQFIASKEFKKTGIDHVIKKQSNENLFTQITENIKERIVINIACSRKSMVNNKRIKIAIDSLLEPGNIQDTAIKFGVAASDLISGQGFLFTEDDIVTAIVASSSIPGFLPPIEIDNRILLDGVITDPVPIKPAHKLGAKVVIAVNVSPDLVIQKNFANIIDIMIRHNQMTGDAYNNILLEDADVVIRPNVGAYHWAEFNNIDYMIKAGEKAATEAIVKIKKITRRRFYYFRG